jgi:hypothetical protein
VEETFVPPHTEKSHYSSKTRNIRENPRNFGKSGDSEKNLETPASQGQDRKSQPRECAGAKVSLIGFVLTTRASIRLLEDTFPIPLYSTAFLGLKFKI